MRPAETYVVVDLEATCCDRHSIPRHETEIIEIGAVLVDGTSLEVVDAFSTFVRPRLHPELTAFCTELTTIRQEQVDDAPLFPAAAAALTAFAGGALFCSWGDYDRNQLALEAERNAVSHPLPGEHVNLKRQFQRVQRAPKGFGMARALALAGLPLEGTHHRGIDDARNIARLMPYIRSGLARTSPAPERHRP